MNSAETAAGKAIVVGATSGIGMEVARLLAGAGWKVGIAGRRTERLAELCHEQENIVCCEQIDITKDDAPEKLQSLTKKLGGMDLYFHSSGIGWENISLDPDKELLTIDTNGMGFVRMLTAAYNYMAAHGGGHIAAISSVAGTRGLGAAPAYSAVKVMQQHYLESLAQLSSLRRLPITITDIRPGFVDTALLAGGNYPLQLNATDVAKDILKAIRQKTSVSTIDWRYRLMVFFWRRMPRALWTRMRIR